MALITIIIADSKYLDERGFAEMKEFSAFPNEDEVLFNIRSQFRVLETKTEVLDKNSKPIRHLILLYGAQEMRESILEQNPTIKINTKKDGLITCDSCNSEICPSSNLQQIIFINLQDQTEHLCIECVEKTTPQKVDPYLCVLLESYRSKTQAKSMIEVKGMILENKKELSPSFYGSKCVKCQTEDIRTRQLSCSECFDERKVWCYGCFDAHNDCLKNEHNIIWKIVHSPFGVKKCRKVKKDVKSIRKKNGAQSKVSIKEKHILSQGIMNNLKNSTKKS